MDKRKHFEAFFLIMICTGFSNCQDVTWTWLSGKPTGNSFTSENYPGARSGATFWQTKDNKTVWMFGGEYHVDGKQPGLHNDLWTYNQDAGTWTLQHNGSSVTGDVPVPRQLAAGCGVTDSYFVLFGGLGENEAPLGDTWVFYLADKQWYSLARIREKLGASNETGIEVPGSRGDMAYWCRNSIELVVFGGFDNTANLHNDLWKFSLQTLKWKISKKSQEMPKDNMFVAHTLYPAGRSGATTWLYKDFMYMFGGNIIENNQRHKHLMIGNSGDLWRYNSTSDKWDLLWGSCEVCKVAASYGELGVQTPHNNPGCRRRAASWIDSNFNLWMFGGDGIDGSQESLSVFRHSTLLSDLWFFNTHTRLWTWKGGPTKGGGKGNLGEKGKKSKDNLPGSRCEPVVWKLFNKLYMFGGVGHDINGHDGYLNDLWMLDVHLDKAVMKNNPYAGPVFMVIFISMGLVVFVSLVYLLSRKDYLNTGGQRGVKYSRLPVEIQD